MNREDAVEEFVSDLRKGARPSVLDSFGDLGEYIEDNLQELHGYNNVEIRHRPEAIAETYIGPVMGGPPGSNSRRYSLEADHSRAVFELDIRDSSISIDSRGEALGVQQGDFRTMKFEYSSGEESLYQEMIREVENIIAPDEVGYRANEDLVLFEFERDMEDI